MSVSDVVDLIRGLMRDNGEEIVRETGEDGKNVVEYMTQLVQARLTQRDLHLSLWEEFTADPDGSHAEVVGALEAVAEGDRDLASHLNQLLEEYNSLAAAAGTAWQPPEKEAGQTIVDGLNDDLSTQSETLAGVTAAGDMVEGLPDREDLVRGEPRPRPDEDDANAEIDRLAEEDSLLHMAMEGELEPAMDATGGTLPEASPDAGDNVAEAAREALGADKELRQLADTDRSDLVDVTLDDPDLDDNAFDAGREESMLSDFERESLPGGLTGRVAIQDGEDIGGDTYIADRFVPDEDLADDYRPGSLYDRNPDDAISYEQSLRPHAITVADIENALEPVRVALDAGEFPEVDQRQVNDRLDRIRDELLRGLHGDANHLREELMGLRDLSRGVWDMLWWELADLAEDLPPASQAVVKELGAAR